jgi:DUF971 family protein
MHSRWVVGLTVLAVVLSVGSVGLVGTSAGQAAQCQPIEDRQLCLTEFTVSEAYLLQGSQGDFSVTVENTGNESATGVVLLRTASPANETNVYRVQQVTLDPGETETLSRSINATTLGTHGLRLSVVDPPTQRTYDWSEIQTIEVREDHPKQLGGPIDRTEIALVALLGSLCCLLGFGYRQLRS